MSSILSVPMSPPCLVVARDGIWAVLGRAVQGGTTVIIIQRVLNAAAAALASLYQRIFGRSAAATLDTPRSSDYQLLGLETRAYINSPLSPGLQMAYFVTDPNTGSINLSANPAPPSTSVDNIFFEQPTISSDGTTYNT